MRKPLSLGLLCALSLASTVALAGRPLVVDDAGVNDAGKGHVEFWGTKAPVVKLLTVAPAYAPWHNVELGGAFSRESDSGLKVMALQVKWRITPSQEKGCNVAAIGGISRASLSGVHINAPYVTGLGTCNVDGIGSFSVNLGYTKPEGDSATGSWGVSFERSLGPVTPHIEWFGSEGSKPTINLGLRGLVADNLQLDGSVGRSAGETITTLGVKLTF